MDGQSFMPKKKLQNYGRLPSSQSLDHFFEKRIDNMTLLDYVKYVLFPKEYYGEELKSMYGDIVEISTALKAMRDKHSDDPDIMNDIDNIGWKLAKFAKRYTKNTLEMFRYVPHMLNK